MRSWRGLWFSAAFALTLVVPTAPALGDVSSAPLHAATGWFHATRVVSGGMKGPA